MLIGRGYDGLDKENAALPEKFGKAPNGGIGGIGGNACNFLHATPRKRETATFHVQNNRLVSTAIERQLTNIYSSN